MLIERIWTANALRNFHYLIACAETGEALAVDPLEWQRCLSAAQARGWQIRQILNTHEHGDHTGGNAGLVGATGAKQCWRMPAPRAASAASTAALPPATSSAWAAPWSCAASTRPVIR
jgi:glyoxylase-like metal-dependent hydrolase (beta-lactamase superfamily II)